MMTHDEMIAVIQADKEGKRIQASHKGGMATGRPREWFTVSEDDVIEFNFEIYDYRLSPEPLVLWAIYNNITLLGIYSKKEHAEEGMKVMIGNLTLKKFVEVME